MTDVGVGVLGTAVVADRGRTRELGAMRQRALLSVLALRRGMRVPTEVLVSAVWGSKPPTGAAGTLQGYVADLRRVLEPRRAPRAAATVLVTEPGGYALRLDEEHVDAARFEAVVRRAGAALPRLVPGPLHLAGADAHRAVLDDWRRELDAALALWRGEPFSDLAPGSRASSDTSSPDLEVELEVDLERDRLRALRLDAEVLRLTALLGCGEHAAATTDLERLSRQHPWDERIWVLLATALARTGRQADALARLRELRASLADELGLDPGPGVGELETAILRHEVSAAAAAPDGPIRVFAAPAGTAAGEPPLVGRRDERALLDRLLHAAATGPQLLHLTGEHGLGRTRLVREAARTADLRGFAVVETTCARAAVREELWAWRRLLSGLQAVAGVDAVAPATAAWSPVQAAEEALGLIHAACAQRPALVVLEDVHWADAGTLSALSHVAARLPRSPVLLVVTQRLAPVAPSSAMAGLLSALARAQAVHHALAGLSPIEVGELLAEVRCGPVGSRAIEDAARRSEGNPFVVVELARHDRLHGGPLPESVRAVVADALRGLPVPTADLLSGASLLDPVFDAGLLAEAAGLDPAEVFEVLAPAVAWGLLREETRYRYSFAVGVVREALAEALTAIRRARWQADLALAAARRRARDDVPLLLPAPPPGAASAAVARYDPPAERMYPS